VKNSLVKSYFEYNPDEDYNGSRGMEIAERVFRKCNYDFNELHKWITYRGLIILEELSKDSLHSQ
jgi:hypothetical protein